MPAKRVAIAARNAGRGGSSNTAENRHGAGAEPRACHAASPRPVPRQTSHARAKRWPSEDRNLAGRVRVHPRQFGMQPGRPVFGQQ